MRCFGELHAPNFLESIVPILLHTRAQIRSIKTWSQVSVEKSGWLGQGPHSFGGLSIKSPQKHIKMSTHTHTHIAVLDHTSEPAESAVMSHFVGHRSVCSYKGQQWEVGTLWLRTPFSHHLNIHALIWPCVSVCAARTPQCVKMSDTIRLSAFKYLLNKTHTRKHWCRLTLGFRANGQAEVTQQCFNRIIRGSKWLNVREKTLYTQNWPSEHIRCSETASAAALQSDLIERLACLLSLKAFLFLHLTC